MRKFSAFIAALLAGVFGIWYCLLIWVHRIEPSLATWTIFQATTIISFFTYAKESKRKSGNIDYVSNIANTMDTIGVSVILFVIIICGSAGQWHFQTFDIYCLIASGAILCSRWFTKSEITTNLAVQAVMVVAYLPMIHKMWIASQNPEAFGPWTVQLAICIFSLCAAIAGRSFLSIVYAGRATTLVAIILALMLRLKFRNG